MTRLRVGIATLVSHVRQFFRGMRSDVGIDEKINTVQSSHIADAVAGCSFFFISSSRSTNSIRTGLADSCGNSLHVLFQVY